MQLLQCKYMHPNYGYVLGIKQIVFVCVCVEIVLCHIIITLAITRSAVYMLESV